MVWKCPYNDLELCIIVYFKDFSSDSISKYSSNLESNMYI